MAGTIQSSKPTLTGISSTSPSKYVLSVNREGILMERGGPIYMTHSFMTSTTTTLTQEMRLTDATLSTVKDESCCEGTALVTDVELTTESASSVTNVAVADVKEDIFLPILFTDSYGNLMPVIRSSTAADVYGGTPLRRRL
tara:strand:+ start:3357 stop:3779 length:423 start_codon:yes stop_codon:yes gene_type:complete